MAGNVLCYGDDLDPNGIHQKVVQERLGHAMISTAMNIYSRVLPGMRGLVPDSAAEPPKPSDSASFMLSKNAYIRIEVLPLAPATQPHKTLSREVPEDRVDG